MKASFLFIISIISTFNIYPSFNITDFQHRLAQMRSELPYPAPDELPCNTACTIVKIIESKFPEFKKPILTPEEEEQFLITLKPLIQELKTLTPHEDFSKGTHCCHLPTIDIAIQSGNLKLVQLLNQYGANFKARLPYNSSLIFSALRYPIILKWMLENKKRDLEINYEYHQGLYARIRLFHTLFGAYFKQIQQINPKLLNFY